VLFLNSDPITGADRADVKPFTNQAVFLPVKSGRGQVGAADHVRDIIGQVPILSMAHSC
jgi:hypothetical protein